jgi:hypothetical protein
MGKLFTSIILFFATGVAFGQTPTANFTISDNALCEGECISITNASSTNTQSWLWTFAGGTPSTFSGPNPGPVCFNNPGSFTITLTVQNTFGTNSATQSLVVTATPTISVTLADTLRDTLLFDPPGQPSDDEIYWKAIGDTAICMFDQAYLWAQGSPLNGSLKVYESGVTEMPVFEFSEKTSDVVIFIRHVVYVAREFYILVQLRLKGLLVLLVNMIYQDCKPFFLIGFKFLWGDYIFYF